MSIAENIAMIRGRMAAAAERAGRSPGDIRLLAVTKHIPPERIHEAIQAGVTDLGENRVQEGAVKMDALGRAGLHWHLIGSLQTNKVRQAVPHFGLIHSLDRWKLAEALQDRASELGIRQPVLIEVNVSGEESKHGLSPDELPDFLDSLRGLPRIVPSGLMTMAPFVTEIEETRPVFRGLRLLFQQMGRERNPGGDWRHLSMGMSNDFEVAVEEGATMVRIGSAIFSSK